MRNTLAVPVYCLVLAACGVQKPAAAPPPGPPPPQTIPIIGPGETGAPAAEKSAARNEYAAVVDAADRDADDKALDPGRHPAELLSFFGIHEGMKVAEFGAGGGYMSELLARTVGPSGVVYGQNTKFVLDRFAQKPWTLRLEKPVMKNVVRVDREFDDPLPAEARNLDAILVVLVYHDTVWMHVDRNKMNRAALAALRPGGIYGIVDHQSRDGAGTDDVQTLHRIEEKTVRQEVESAGFQFVAEAGFLRNPGDAHDWNDSPRAAGDRRGTSDRFVLKFQKP